MELFPAIDEEQWIFITKVIDDCDYYILILGGRYGSTTTEGISYTEKEFYYAVSKEIRVIALLHENPDALPIEKSDIEPEARKRLQAFRQKVSDGRLVRTWKIPSELPGLVTTSLLKTIKTYPALGWTRQAGPSNEELLQELNTLRKERDRLAEELQQLKSEIEVESDQLASGSDVVRIYGDYRSSYDADKRSWQASIAWDRILYHVGPRLYKHEHDHSVSKYIAASVLGVDIGKKVHEAYLSDDVFYTIRIQLEASGYVKVESLSLQNGGVGIFWRLTPKGKKRLFSLRLIEKESEVSPPDPDT